MKTETPAPTFQTSSDPTVATSTIPARIGQTTQSDRMSQHKMFALGLSIFIVAVVLWPIGENWRPKPEDSFPLSYYPMFTKDRGETSTCTYLVGFDAKGNRHLLQYTLAPQTGGLNQVRRQIDRLVRNGKAREVCRRVADRVAKDKREPYSQIVAVQVVTGTYLLNDYFTGKSKTPLKEIVHARIDLPEAKP